MIGPTGFKPYRYEKAVYIHPHHPTGVIYRASPPVSALKPKQHSFKGWPQVVGYACLGIALLGVGMLASPWVIAEGIKTLTHLQNRVSATAIEPLAPSPTVIPTASPSPMPTPDPATLPFSIQIPKILVDSKVVSNVNAADETIYRAALKEGVAHALGSAFPGEGKMIYIFGHSTDYAWNVATYNALFYQVKDLVAGDPVQLTLGSRTFQYRVREQRVISPTDIHVLEEFNDQNVLILQTCYPPGTTWQRLLVIAEPIK